MTMNFFLMNFNIVDLILLILIFMPSNLYKFHPLMFSIMLIIFTIIISIKMNYLMTNFIYSYILFLFMIGGVMILIMYFTSISSNELIEFNKKFLKYFFLKLFFLMFLFMFLMILMYKNFLINFFNNFDMMNFNKIFLDNLNYFILKNLYMYMNLDLTIFFLMYLFLMMMFSTIICMKFKIPMRQLLN
uniref:NADH dehydrogenase subunit 6 n=1 Tax=Cotesia flavipes TaxID=89805 RepID=UPI0020294162|nr:NADH dehydrogenase subunit 6 [Cotesia flavipes]UQS76152.1 NADH dehydrogenase subunit 6 [Cotesia flavipes]